MRLTRFFSIFILGLMILQSCKKESTVVSTSEYDPNVAPCVITDKVYQVDSVFYGPGVDFPQAKFRIRFSDTSGVGSTFEPIEFAFNKIPTSGMYYMVTEIDTMSLIYENQIAFIKDSGSFVHRSATTDFPEVYIENNVHELIISYCDISNAGVQFDGLTQTYTGNSPATVKIRMSY